MTVSLTERITVNLSPHEREQLRRLAAREQRSEAWIARRAILSYLVPPSITERQAK